MPRTRLATSASITSRCTLGEIGDRGISAGSTTRTLVARNSVDMPVSLVRCNRLSYSCRLLSASRCSTPYSIPVRFWLSASFFCALSAACRLCSWLNAA